MRSRSHRAMPWLWLAAQFVGAEFHHVGFAQVEIAGLIAQRASQQDFDAAQERAASNRVLVGFIYGEPSGFPAHNGESGAQ